MPDELDTQTPRPQSRISAKSLLIVGYTSMILLFTLLVGLPFWHETSAVEEQILKDRSEIQARTSSIKSLSEVTKTVELVTLRVKNYNRLVPSNQDLGPFLEQMSHTLDASGMKEVSFRALPPMTLGKSQQLPIEVSGLCTYPQFHHFLEQMESLPRMSSVSHLLIESDSSMSGKVAVNLTLSIYNTKPANQDSR